LQRPQIKFIGDSGDQAMQEVQDQIEIVQEEEQLEIVELSLTDLQRVGGGAGNAAIDF